jgi:hypothetical protein
MATDSSRPGRRDGVGVVGMATAAFMRLSCNAGILRLAAHQKNFE